MTLFIEPTITDPRTQQFHTRMVTSLMHSACGDLCLNARGNLCVKRFYDAKTGEPLPEGQYRDGEVLAHISRNGWELTGEGAQFILENCCFEKRDAKKLEAVVAAARSKWEMERAAAALRMVGGR